MEQYKNNDRVSRYAGDTTAAVYGQIAGAYCGASGIPAHWLKRLTMREEITSLADRLYSSGVGSSLVGGWPQHDLDQRTVAIVMYEVDQDSPCDQLLAISLDDAGNSRTRSESKHDD